MLAGSMSACLAVSAALYSWATLNHPLLPLPPLLPHPYTPSSFSSSGALTKDLAVVLETSTLHLHRGVVTRGSPVPLLGEGSDPQKRLHREPCANAKGNTRIEKYKIF